MPPVIHKNLIFFLKDLKPQCGLGRLSRGWPATTTQRNPTLHWVTGMSIGQRSSLSIDWSNLHMLPDEIMLLETGGDSQLHHLLITGMPDSVTYPH